MGETRSGEAHGEGKQHNRSIILTSIQCYFHSSTTAAADNVFLICCICPLRRIIIFFFHLRKNTDDVALLSAGETSKRWPEMVIRFYEDKLTWHGEDEQ